MIYKYISKNCERLKYFKWIFQITTAFFIVWVYFNPHIRVHPFFTISLILLCYILQDYIGSVIKNIDAEKIAEKIRETYIATLTHDLKTPTIAQIKALELLLNNHIGPLNNEQKELLSLTKDSCNFMYEMLSTLLNTYKYENGDYVMNYETCNIISLAEETINELESMLKEKNITVHINKDGSVFDTECDKMQIKRVLTNILGNAISYAYNNTKIVIAIKQDKDGIRFEAKNESAYINPETMDNLFKKYVSHAAKYNKVGVGLGLYLSKQIINAHNGNIYAKSYEDNHNIFGFVLPIENVIKYKKDAVY